MIHSHNNHTSVGNYSNLRVGITFGVIVVALVLSYFRENAAVPRQAAEPHIAAVERPNDRIEFLSDVPIDAPFLDSRPMPSPRAAFDSNDVSSRVSVADAGSSLVNLSALPPYENTRYSAPVVDDASEPNHGVGVLAQWDQPQDKYATRVRYAEPIAFPSRSENAAFIGVDNFSTAERYSATELIMPRAETLSDSLGPEEPPYDTTRYVAPLSSHIFNE